MQIDGFLVWALNINGDFNTTITNSDLPPDSPIQLTTSDIFFQQAVPDIKHYPDMDINIITSLYKLSDVSLTSTDGTLINNMALLFH